MAVPYHYICSLFCTTKIVGHTKPQPPPPPPSSVGPAQYNCQKNGARVKGGCQLVESRQQVISIVVTMCKILSTEKLALLLAKFSLTQEKIVISCQIFPNIKQKVLPYLLIMNPKKTQKNSSMNLIYAPMSAN